MRLLLPLMLAGCYTLENYWEDVAEVHCHCSRTFGQRRLC